jgi:hypothetical protein|tara:strand:- start:266 stop:430 length:165 start_codon:yes stop_codon:yes gene_type:complete
MKYSDKKANEEKESPMSFADRTMFEVKAFDAGISQERAREIYREYFSKQPENWK